MERVMEQINIFGEGKHKETVVEVGEYTVVQGTGNDVYVYRGGEWVLRASCTKKLSEDELRKFADHYEKLKGADHEQREAE